MAFPSTPSTASTEPPAARLVVLAGQREGAGDALAERFAVSHRGLVPLAGRPLIAHVLQTAAHHPAIESLAICIEREAFDPVWDVLTRLPGRGAVTLVEAQADLAESVRAAAQGWDGPLLVTTADHALLSCESIDALLAALTRADIALLLTPRAAVTAIHPEASRHYLPLREGDLAPCDLYGIASVAHIEAASVFRGRRASGRISRRILRATGIVGLLALWLRLESLPGAVERASRRLKARVRAVVTPDGSQAIDVGDEQTYAIVRHRLEAQAGDAQVALPEARSQAI
ncbi:NTP transferase domain-containing protein [Novosphingobium sp. 1949]|uniref:NTP transferase domain-containing protein n=1 Tax=Novosphingobium organovorum TaxID=2930092 RepID=A0ABT0BIG8_9SPHN|nr:NTP transferase domain-containing protein [Novosphingobium organovorum]MCJ2184851.1 NTP transferase domain-containing protein [Novosphingobium organovorum]